MFYSSQDKGVDTPIDGSLVILGKPVAQKRHRYTFKKGFARNYDPSSTDKKQTWLQIAKYLPVLPLTGSISINLIFYMPRPKHHYRTGKYKHLLKDSCKETIYHSVKPDLDNLVKYIIDVMNKGYYVDDSQVCVIQAQKIYSFVDIPRTEVTIEER